MPACSNTAKGTASLLVPLANVLVVETGGLRGQKGLRVTGGRAKPIQQVTTHRLVINLKTAKGLGLLASLFRPHCSPAPTRLKE
jgi:hypothetical protein